MDTEAGRERKGLGQQSSGHGAISRIRTATSGPAQKRSTQDPPKGQTALICCVIFVRAKLLSHGESVARMALRCRSEPIIGP